MNATNPFKAAVVDELSVRVVVDSRYERFLPKATHSCVSIEHVGRIPGREMTTFAAEWGLSLHLASVQAGARAEYLLDFGYTPEILNRNFDLLDINPASINGLILSHSHRDHYGGLDGFVTHHRKRMRKDLALYVGGETVFREKWIKEKDSGPQSVGAPNQVSLRAQNVATMCCQSPRALDGPFTSGYIARSRSKRSPAAHSSRTITTARRSARASWCAISIPTSMPPATSSGDAGSWSSPRADTPASSTPCALPWPPRTWTRSTP